jgi:hypothetical protein
VESVTGPGESVRLKISRRHCRLRLSGKNDL